MNRERFPEWKNEYCKDGKLLLFIINSRIKKLAGLYLIKSFWNILKKKKNHRIPEILLEKKSDEVELVPDINHVRNDN